MLDLNPPPGTRWLWLTDIHLEFLEEQAIGAFLLTIKNAAVDGVLISGDIGTGSSVTRFLAQFADTVSCPVCFVLGNHDFYGSSLAEVRARVNALCAARAELTYLSDANSVRLADDVALIGQDGWGDGRASNYAASRIDLNDFLLIDELRNRSRADRLAAIRAIGDAEVSKAEPKLRKALAQSRDVVFLTHVPPFPEAAVGADGRSDRDYLPFFCCHAMGIMLYKMMLAYPGNRLFVFCGHTHSRAVVRILPNLIVRAGEATYGKPDYAGVVDAANMDEWK